MKKRHTPQEKANINVETGLRSFLISRFITAISVSFVIGQIINLVIRLCFPLLRRIFLFGEYSLNEGSLITSLKFVFVTLLRAFEGLLPGQFGRIFTIIINKYMTFSIIPPAVDKQGPLAVFFYNASILLVFLTILILSVLPYVIAAYWYFKKVTLMVNELRENDLRKRMEYEKDRNLMLANLAHDIKTPITTVVGYSRALMDGLVPEDKHKDYLSTINSKSMRISEMVNFLFEYSKLDSTGFTLDKTEIDLGELTLECLAECYTDFEEENIELDIDVPEKKMSYVADGPQLRRVIHNLISNSIKYIGEGNKVSVRLQTPTANNNNYCIIFADNGISIDDELAAHIFEPFSRGDKTRSSKGGSGLGLSIAYKIVKYHNGNLTLDNHPDGEYSKTFTITLPCLL